MRFHYLKRKYPTLTDEELNLCCLICFGFNNSQIGILFGGTNPNSVFNKRHKLRKKMGLWPNYDSLEAYLAKIVSELRERTIALLFVLLFLQKNTTLKVLFSIPQN